MPNLNTVTLTNGIPTAGTGTVSTIDNTIGVAGTPSAQVLSVQGVTSMTPVKVDGSGVTQPVSQSGTFTVQPGNTANTTAWKVDGSAVTQPISGTVTSNAILNAETTKVIGVVRTADGSGNLLTSTGNALDINVKSGGNANGQTTMSASAPVTIASDQSAVAVKGSGTAGTANAGVVTVQGIASMTKLLVTPDSVALPANQSVNLAQVNGTTVAVGSGVQATAERVTLATDSPGIVTLGRATAANSVPIVTGPALLGSYAMGANSGTMAAGLAGGSPVFSFRYGAANLAIVRKIVIEADNITTAFVAGAAKVDLIAARSFTASDTGGTAGTLTTNNGKLRTSFATTGVSDFRIASTATLTAGTRTLDAQPLATVEFAVPTSIDADLLPTTVLFQAQTITDQPLVLVQNEGFVIQATVPGTGTWVFSVRVVWDEVSTF